MAGLLVETCGSRLSIIYPVCDTWEELFIKVLDLIFDVEEEVQDADEVTRMLRKAMMGKFAPQLLRHLMTGGRKIIPKLVHSGL